MLKFYFLRMLVSILLAICWFLFRIFTERHGDSTTIAIPIMLFFAIFFVPKHFRELDMLSIPVYVTIFISSAIIAKGIYALNHWFILVGLLSVLLLFLFKFRVSAIKQDVCCHPNLKKHNEGYICQTCGNEIYETKLPVFLVIAAFIQLSGWITITLTYLAYYAPDGHENIEYVGLFIGAGLTILSYVLLERGRVRKVLSA